MAQRRKAPNCEAVNSLVSGRGVVLWRPERGDKVPGLAPARRASAPGIGTVPTPGRRGAAFMLTLGKCPVRSSGQLTCAEPGCRVSIDPNGAAASAGVCTVAATQSFQGYGPWLCCNHARIEGWPWYIREACQNCRVRKDSVNPFTGEALVKGVPDFDARPTSGWTHGKGKARKRNILHNKLLEPQTLASPVTPRSPARKFECCILQTPTTSGTARQASDRRFLESDASPQLPRHLSLEFARRETPVESSRVPADTLLVQQVL